MRTTLVLDDNLFKKARERATASNSTISDVVNEALREALAKPPLTATPFEMLTFAGGDKKMHEPSDFAELLSLDDSASLGR
ncbi:MAG: type II toxin-antitoxin system VapB family antitoxin [Deltaproteobacteria bacterium]|nr:type II toxin-antitoxin system VapB family antitoxin [Deltaproteobacteria bacterium]